MAASRAQSESTLHSTPFLSHTALTLSCCWIALSLLQLLEWVYAADHICPKMDEGNICLTRPLTGEMLEWKYLPSVYGPFQCNYKKKTTFHGDRVYRRHLYEQLALRSFERSRTIQTSAQLERYFCGG